MKEVLTNFYDETVTIEEQAPFTPDAQYIITATVTDSNGEVIAARDYTGRTFDEVVDRWYCRGWRF